MLLTNCGILIFRNGFPNNPKVIESNDSVSVKIKILSRLIKNTQSNLSITNEEGRQIYSKRMHFDAGNHLEELIINLESDAFEGLNIANIEPILEESPDMLVLGFRLGTPDKPTPFTLLVI